MSMVSHNTCSSTSSIEDSLCSVEQTCVVVPQKDFLQTTIDILKQDLQEHPTSSKCMVFFPTARQVSLAAEVLSQISGLPPILEIHSRKSQPARIKAAEQFKTSKSAVLLSSDVAARGVDFPGSVRYIIYPRFFNSFLNIQRDARFASWIAGFW